MNKIIVGIVLLVIGAAGGYWLGISRGPEKAVENNHMVDQETETTATTTPAASRIPQEFVVTYTAQGFSPKTVTIKKGDTVVFENKTGKNASVASDEHPTHLLYPEFDQWKTDQRGKTEFRFTFEKVGTWNYHDHLSANMTGTIIVVE